MKLNAAKEADANEHLVAGKKHLEKSLFKWKADYDSAATEFESAARIYTNISNYPKASDAWLRASKAHAKAHNDFNAANCIERLADFTLAYLTEQRSANSTGSSGATKSLDDHLFKDVIERYEEASRLYGAAVNGAKEAAMLKKATDILSRSIVSVQRQGTATTSATCSDIEYVKDKYKQLVNEVIELMERNMEVMGSKPFDLPDVYRSYFLFKLRSGDIFGAVQVLKQMIGIRADGEKEEAYENDKNLYLQLNQPTNAAKAALEIIVLCLNSPGNDGYAWARTEMDRMGTVFGFCGSPEESAAAALLAAYADRDPEALKEALVAHTCFSFLNSEVSRIAKKLSIDGGSGQPLRNSLAPAAPTPAATLPTTSHEAPPVAPVATASDENLDIDPQEDLR